MYNKVNCSYRLQSSTPIKKHEIYYEEVVYFFMTQLCNKLINRHAVFRNENYNEFSLGIIAFLSTNYPFYF